MIKYGVTGTVDGEEIWHAIKAKNKGDAKERFRRAHEGQDVEDLVVEKRKLK